MDDWSWKPPKASPALERELLVVHGTACLPQTLRDELKSHGIKWKTKGWKSLAISHFGLGQKYKEAKRLNKTWQKQQKSLKKKRGIQGKPKPFYSSWEWKKARFEVLKCYGSKCMCCGSEDRIVVDHIKPRSKFPELELDMNNLQVLCNDCNMGKSNDDYTDFRPTTELTEDELGELEILGAGAARIH